MGRMLLREQTPYHLAMTVMLTGNRSAVDATPACILLLEVVRHVIDMDMTLTGAPPALVTALFSERDR